MLIPDKLFFVKLAHVLHSSSSPLWTSALCISGWNKDSYTANGFFWPAFVMQNNKNDCAFSQAATFVRLQMYHLYLFAELWCWIRGRSASSTHQTNCWKITSQYSTAWPKKQAWFEVPKNSQEKSKDEFLKLIHDFYLECTKLNTVHFRMKQRFITANGFFWDAKQQKWLFCFMLGDTRWTLHINKMTTETETRLLLVQVQHVRRETGETTSATKSNLMLSD